jgi:hypothetical protein
VVPAGRRNPAARRRYVAVEPAGKNLVILARSL